MYTLAQLITMSPDQIRAAGLDTDTLTRMRSEATQAARGILTRANGGNLVGEDATQFDRYANTAQILTDIKDEADLAAIRAARPRADSPSGENAERTLTVTGGELVVLEDGGGNSGAAAPQDPPAPDDARSTAGPVTLTRTSVSDFAAKLARNTLASGGIGATRATLVNNNMTPVGMVGLHAMPDKPRNVLDALQWRTVPNPPLFRYLRQTSRAGSAAAVAAGGTKPTSSLGLTSVDDRLRVYAHLSDPVDKYTLRDVGDLKVFVEHQLHAGLLTAVEADLIDGTGSGEKMTGLLRVSGTQTQTFGNTIAGTIRSAITKLSTAAHTAGLIVVTPADWEAIETSVTNGSGEHVIATAPVDAAASRLWGVPVVVSAAMPAGKALVLDPTAVSIYSDMTIDSEWDVSTGFAKNEALLRVESRFASAVTQPAGVVTVTTTSG